MAVSPLTVIIGCDVDPDRERFGGYSNRVYDKLVWKGVEEGIGRLSKRVKRFRDSEGKRVKITYFLRSDEQMRMVYGEHSWPVNHFGRLWNMLRGDGHELGWHPHLWRWSAEHRTWYQEVNDEEWVRKCLEEGYRSITQELKPKSVRMGWDFHSNLTMQLIDSLGIDVDMSALPGIKDDMKMEGTGLQILFRDWVGTPPCHYFPSKKDYRVGGDESLRILEIPQTVFELPITMRIGKVAKGLLKGSLRTGKLAEPYITRPSSIFKGAIQKALVTENKVLACFFHADELISQERGYGIDNFVDNLRLIEKLCSSSSVEFFYTTAVEAKNMLLRGGE